MGLPVSEPVKSMIEDKFRAVTTRYTASTFIRSPTLEKMPNKQSVTATVENEQPVTTIYVWNTLPYCCSLSLFFIDNFF